MEWKACRMEGLEPCFPFSSQRNKKTPHFIPCFAALSQFEVVDTKILHSIADTIGLKSGDSLAPNTINTHRLPTTESLEPLSWTVNGWPCKPSCAFSHVTAQGLKARSPLESVAAREVSLDDCIFPGMPVTNVEITIVAKISFFTIIIYFLQDTNINCTNKSRFHNKMFLCVAMTTSLLSKPNSIF